MRRETGKSAGPYFVLASSFSVFVFSDADTRYNTALMPESVNSTVRDGWRPPAAEQQRKLLFLVLLGCAIYWLWPRPEEISPQGWRLFAIFASTICGLMLRPLPVGALVLISLTVCALTGALQLREALSGYANPVVWLVLSAFFISRALIKSGLARRIALFFVGVFGRSSIGISFSLILSDVTLAMIIPLEHGPGRRRHPADRTRAVRALRLAAGQDGRLAGRFSDDLGLSGGVRGGGDVSHGPRRQPARGGLCARHRRGRSELGELGLWWGSFQAR